MTVYNTYLLKKTPCIAILNNCVSIKGTKSTLVVVYLSAWISERIFNLSFININYTIFNFFFINYMPDLFSASAFLIYFQNYYITVIKWKLNVMIFDKLFSKLWKLRNRPMQITFVKCKKGHGEFPFVQPIQNPRAFFDYQLRELLDTWSQLLLNMLLNKNISNIVNYTLHMQYFRQSQ